MNKQMNFEEILNEISELPPNFAVSTANAMIGTLAATLGAMIANQTIISKKAVDYENTLEMALENLLEIKEKLLNYAEKSSHNVESFEKSEDKDKILKNIVINSFNVAKLNYNILRNCYEIYKYGDPNLKVEAKRVCYIAWACLNSALISVKSNLEKVNNDEEKENISNDLVEFTNEADSLIEELKEEMRN
ncbi:cyclodeaminase/cyclohydrolase family protein [Petrotoga sp. 9PWA.NaAc.5.4]|uniref:cyclodeaminase/cyclohydrolase family protein n=1 Tax=Petrotoga sp. 9PWA.NaAc.5.4 TaxID=1434328 RepID=UPI000CB1DD71|nr:cyclodeaminase/cyclohydrolase family protein [Petrotoga sp. 9PWA.NaAc.5.4]PNR94737.1 hypothetical protein X924_05595 [Petrotoga sp. 9PWA.NaAc.5.4]